MNKPFFPSAERNKDAILGALQPFLASRQKVIELGSGTGQHAVCFARAMTQLTWQCSDRSGYLDGIRCWLDQAGLSNTPPPIEWDVDQKRWPSGPFDALFTANSLHIMSWAQVQTLFARLPEIMAPTAVVAIYGPFSYEGLHTSPSNAAFDQNLRARDPLSGLRDVDAIQALGADIGLALEQDLAMPANNRLLLWRRQV